MILYALKMFMVVLKYLITFSVGGFFSIFSSFSFSHDEFIDVIAAAKPAVVTVEVVRSKKKIKPRQSIEALGENADFFEDDLKDLNDDYRTSRGTGFIVERANTKAISVLTAAHVVKGASRIKILFSNGVKKKADVIWLSRKKDIALLEVNYNTGLFKPLILSDEVVMEGQSILSISGSFHLSISSSLGIVSAVDVLLPSKKGIPLIQTDAVVNPGSSGGPLLNSKGEVIGLISNIFSKTGDFSGVSFAVPSPIVKELVLFQDGKRS